MPSALRAFVGLVGALFLLSGLNWIVDPGAAASGLGVDLPAGLARSTIVGDLGAFFLAASTFVLLGAVRQEAHWLRAAALLFGLAAFMRTLAWALHGADFAATFILVEIVVAVFLSYAAGRVD